MDKLNAVLKPLFLWALIALSLTILSRGSHSSDAPAKLVRAVYHRGVIDLHFSPPQELETLKLTSFEILVDGTALGETISLRAESEGVLQLQVNPELAHGFAESYVPGSKLHSPPRLVFHAPNAGFQDSSVFMEADENEIGVYQGKLFPDSPALRPYYGELHAHTDLSDGRKKPEAAFETAKAHGLDFFAVTDHMEYLDINPEKWAREKQYADASDCPGSFVAFSGFEWSGFPEGASKWMNHLNFINSPHLLSAFDSSRLDEVYSKIAYLPNSSVGIFNHPGYKHYLDFQIDNWHAFAYSGSADRNLKLIRVEGEDEVQSFKKGYIPALNRGWHLGPEADEDTHSGHFASSMQRTGVWAAQLVRADLVTAFRAMATFFTADPSASLKLTADHQWLMGSTLKGPGAHHLDSVFTSLSGARVKQVDWYSYPGVLVNQDLSGANHSGLDVNPEGDTYYFVQVTEENGARLISAPIFIDR